MNIAPDLFSKEVHEGSHPSACKWWFKARRLVVLRTPRDMAKNYLRSELGKGVSESSIIERHGYSGNIYYGFTQQPNYHGKVKVSMYGKEDQMFSIRELLNEIKLEKTQRPLFKF